MKNFLIVLVALILGAAGGYFAWKYLDVSGGKSGSKREKITAAGYNQPFMWGVNVRPSPLRNYSIDTWIAQMDYVKALGLHWIRLTFDYAPANKFEIFDEMVNYANSQNINVFLLLSSSKPILSIDNTYQDGYQVASDVSSHYKGKVKYYQLMSEQGSTALKGADYSGENESDYDTAKYEKVKEWMRGASDAIRKNDPGSYIVISDQWTHYAYLQMLQRDKIDYDITGWDWFGDMGQMKDQKISDGTLLTDKLKSFNKPIILVEVNYRPGKTGMNEDKQADYIQQMTTWAYNSDFIKGFFFHELVDLRPIDDKPGDFYGLVKYKPASSGGYTFDDIRKVFGTYKDIVAQYSK